MEFHQYYREYIPWYADRLKARISRRSPHALYDPLHYILEHGGKQIRPALLSAIAQAFGNTGRERSFPLASGIEMIHNFTLIHDDIMDADELRHGKQTVHAKWDTNRAILAGDGLFVHALSELDAYKEEPSLYARLLPLILQAVMRVCEGQAEDMEFEERREVSLDEYLDMVTKKTACLLAVSGRLGAVLGGAEAGEEELTEKVLLELGIVFQIQDDLLELTSDAEKMGKTLGSDLVNKKKTFPYLFAKKELPPEEWEDFLAAAAPENIAGQGTGPARRVLERNFIFDKINDIITLRHASIQEMIRKLPPRTQEMFRSMVTFVMHREH